jgi:ABC-type multidrug transport system ATPase subunit
MIQLSGLSKRFGNVTAVDQVSLTVSAGETVALLGPNGSGKTTTLKCITGLARPDGGQVIIGGIDITKQPKLARSLMTFLPQRVAFCENLTALEIMQFYCRLRKLSPQRINQVLEELGLASVARDPVGRFSGGMIQRLGVAVALLPQTPVLVLDEPAVNLDPAGATVLRQMVRSAKQAGRTILFSTHDLRDVELLADRAAILVDGKLVAVESVNALRGGLSAGSRLRLAMRQPSETFAQAALAAGATDAEIVSSDLWIVSQPERRLAILHAVEAAGGVVEQFSTEEPSLEEIYMRYVNAKNVDPVRADCVGLRDAIAETG